MRSSARLVALAALAALLATAQTASAEMIWRGPAWDDLPDLGLGNNEGSILPDAPMQAWADFIYATSIRCTTQVTLDNPNACWYAAALAQAACENAAPASARPSDLRQISCRGLRAPEAPERLADETLDATARALAHELEARDPRAQTAGIDKPGAPAAQGALAESADALARAATDEAPRAAQNAARTTPTAPTIAQPEQPAPVETPSTPSAPHVSRNDLGADSPATPSSVNPETPPTHPATQAASAEASLETALPFTAAAPSQTTAHAPPRSAGTQTPPGASSGPAPGSATLYRTAQAQSTPTASSPIDASALAAALPPVVASIVLASGALLLYLVGFALYHRLTHAGMIDNAHRARILQLVRERPGLTETELSDALQITRQSVNYHARMLGKTGQLVVRPMGARRLHYAPSAAKAYVPTQAQTRVLDALAARDGAPVSQADIAHALDVGRSVALRHLRRLVEAGAIVEERVDGRPMYRAAMPASAAPVARAAGSA